MKPLEYRDRVTEELTALLAQVDDQHAEALADAILAAKKVYVSGVGRSGLCCRAFAMRLMHMGFSAFVPGEMSSPAMEEADLLIVCSGSGETPSQVAIAGKARQLGGKVALVTIAQGSSIGRTAHLELLLPASTCKRDDMARVGQQPMGSLFEQGLWVTLDILIMKLMDRTGRTESEMFARHANLE